MQSRMFPNRWQTVIFLLIFTILKASAQTGGTPSGVEEFCVAIPGADPNALLDGLNWACGPGQANCNAIQQGQPCYQANNLTAVASYAYNSYYQMTKGSGGTCSFNNTATLTPNDPSYGSCIFTGSTGVATNPSSGTGTTIPNTSPTGFATSPISDNPGFINPGSGVPALRVLRIGYPLVVIAHVWFYL